MNEELKKKLRELLKEGIRVDGWGYDILEADLDGFLEIMSKFIESSLKEARIDENKLWAKKCQQNPLSNQEFLVTREAFEDRIKKLRGEKK